MTAVVEPSRPRRLPAGRRLLSAGDAEHLLGIPSSTIRNWARRHRATGLYAAGHDNRGRPIYREVDLVRIRRGEKIRHPDGEWIDPRS